MRGLYGPDSLRVCGKEVWCCGRSLTTCMGSEILIITVSAAIKDLQGPHIRMRVKAALYNL